MKYLGKGDDFVEMDHLKALIIKFVMCSAILLIVLSGFYGVSFANVLTISIILTGVSYIIGDLYLLPRFDNWVATIADFGLTFVGVWVLGAMLFARDVPLIASALLSALLIAAGEYFYHKYLESHVISHMDQRQDDGLGHRDLQTEFSSELDDHQQQSDIDRRSNDDFRE